MYETGDSDSVDRLVKANGDSGGRCATTMVKTCTSESAYAKIIRSRTVRLCSSYNTYMDVYDTHGGRRE